jgi:hypothetical protein
VRPSSISTPVKCVRACVCMYLCVFVCAAAQRNVDACRHMPKFSKTKSKAHHACAFRFCTCSECVHYDRNINKPLPSCVSEGVIRLLRHKVESNLIAHV